VVFIQGGPVTLEHPDLVPVEAQDVIPVAGRGRVAEPAAPD